MKKKTRDSNIELLRMLAMFLVLLVHADFLSLGTPTLQDIQTSTLDSTLRIFFEALSIVCVNVFVLISGWFGIRPSLKGISNFIFQCLFFYIGIYVVTFLIGTSTLSLRGGIMAMDLNWFIRAYLLLYILSPVLNAFVESADREIFRNVLIAYFVFACLYGFIDTTEFMMGGYTPLFFIGLYLLARYMRIYQPNITKFKCTTDLMVYIVVSVFVTVVCVLPPLLIGRNFQPWWNYIAPTTILGAVSLLLAFSKMKFQSKFVNWCGASCFAVFLLHINPNILRHHFKDLFIYLHNHCSTLEFWGLTFVILIAIFFIAIIIDQLRIILWDKVWPIIEQINHDKHSK